MNVGAILGHKGHDVVTMPPERTVLDAVHTMVEHNIGAVVVSEGVGVQGILSERGVLRLTAESPSLLSTTLIRDSMTVDVIVAAKSDSVPQVMDVMTAKRIRHLPVVEGGLLEGIVSIGDLVNALRSKAEDENRHLRDYIRGGAS